MNIKRINKKWIIIGSVILALVIFRLILPSIVLKHVNKSLQEIEGFTGHVEDIDIHLYRGAYVIKGLDLKKTGGKVPVPFFATPETDISIEWKSIFDGKIVSEIDIYNPQLNFVVGPTEEQSQTSIDKHWTEVVKDLVPIDINRLQIFDGEIHYLDTKKKPAIDLFLNNVDAIALNLSNVENDSKALPSPIEATGNAYGNGKFRMTMNMDALKKDPTFDLNAELTGVDITKLNDFLKASANVDANAGTFHLYTELAAKHGGFEGYVKPVIKDLDLVDWKKEKKDGFFHRLYETIIGGASEVIENHPEDQIAAKIPIKGSFDNPQPDIWATIGSLLKNAFIQALKPSIDNSVQFSGQPKSKEEIKQDRKAKDKQEKAKEKEAEKKGK